jgi:hypothetical protein
MCPVRLYFELEADMDLVVPSTWETNLPRVHWGEDATTSCSRQ